MYIDTAMTIIRQSLTVLLHLGSNQGGGKLSRIYGKLFRFLKIVNSRVNIIIGQNCLKFKIAINLKNKQVKTVIQIIKKKL